MGKTQVLLEKLQRPMSYIGEERTHFAFLDGTWTDLKEVISGSWNPEVAMPLLRKRLQEIIDELSRTDIPDGLAEDLYKEGQGIRWAIGVLSTGSKAGSTTDDPKDDLRRWIDYSKRIS
jgi:hypothetical protein